MRIQLKLSDGLKISDDNKISTNWTQSTIDDNPIIQNDGIYIPNINGKDGRNGDGTIVDGYTILDNGDGTIKQNRDVIMNIFSMSAWKTQQTGRTTNNIPYLLSSNNEKQPKNKSDILSEINFLFNHNDRYTSYNMKVGDLFQLVVDYKYTELSYPYTFRNIYEQPMEDGNRYVDRICAALFVVDSVTPTPNGYPGQLNDIRLHCLWSMNDNYWHAGSDLN